MARTGKLPEPEPIRDAIVNVLRVAACYEKRIEAPSDQISDRDALRLLNKLVAASKRFDQSRKERRRRALGGTIASEVAEIYRALRRGAIKSEEAPHLLWKVVREKMYPLTPDEFQALMLSDQDIRRHPDSGKHGPVEAAQTSVADVFGVVPNTIRNWQKKAGSYELPTLAFGIGLGRSGLLRYALSLFAPEGPDVERAQAILERATSDPEEDADPE